MLVVFTFGVLIGVASYLIPQGSILPSVPTQLPVKIERLSDTARLAWRLHLSILSIFPDLPRVYPADCGQEFEGLLLDKPATASNQLRLSKLVHPLKTQALPAACRYLPVTPNSN
jgi:hypothetical protein